MRVVTGHKSILHFDTRITGLEAHSSQQHRGVPAVMVAGRLINWLGEKQRENEANADLNNAFEPPFSTLHCGVVHGGTAVNITARHCDFVTDIRTLPTEDAMSYFDEYVNYVRDVVEPEMQSVSPDTKVEIEVHANVRLTHRKTRSSAVGEATFWSEYDGSRALRSRIRTVSESRLFRGNVWTGFN